MNAPAPEPLDQAALRLLKAGDLRRARQCAEQAVAGQRVLVPAHGLLATILVRMDHVQEATDVIAQALVLAPGTGDSYDALAFAATAAGDHGRAHRLYQLAVEQAPGESRFWHNLATSERYLGQLPAAERACDRAIALDPRHFAAYLLRAELQLQTADRNHVAELSQLLETSGDSGSAAPFLGYALGKELDDLGRYDEAFAHFERAARARRRRLQYDVAIDERKLARIAEVFTAPLLADSALPEDSARYVFIVGLPRSGTTLLERVLSNLPGVHSNGETDFFSRALFSAAPPGVDPFDGAARATPSAVGSAYRKLAGRTRAGNVVIEKLPLNYLYVGAIHRALPKAPIVWVTRSPLDSCFAMWRTLFGTGYPFSYEFGELARYFAAYERLRRHWHAVLPGRICEIAYEDLVANPTRAGCDVANYCGLPWEDAAIDVTRNAAVSTTASASQVRRPIYTTSSGRWRHYRAHLGPLRAALESAGVCPH